MTESMSSADRRHDFGFSLAVNKCCKCGAVTRNRGDQKSGDRYCSKCYNLAFPVDVIKTTDKVSAASVASAQAAGASSKDKSVKVPAKTGASAEEAAQQGVKLHVKNLDEKLDTAALLALFEPHGTLKRDEVKIISTKEGKSKGFGQVIFTTQEDAEKAIAALHNTKQGEKSMVVVLAPDAGTKPTSGNGKGKEKGKHEKGKGKGKRNSDGPPAHQGAAGYPAVSATPQIDPSVLSQMDPFAAQIWQQQMYTWSLYANMAQQPQPNETGQKGKGKGKGKARADRGTKVEGTFKGKLKSINWREDKGFGFIDCEKTKATYGRDVYVTCDRLSEGAKVGDQFEFSVTLDERGQLRANNVKSIAY